MTASDNHNDTNWKPDLASGQALLFETERGFKGHIKIQERLFRVFLTQIDGTNDERRAALTLIGTAADGAEVSGKIIQNLDESVCIRPVRPAPVVFGHLTINRDAATQYELAAWLRYSRAGARYVTGRVTQISDTDG